MATSQAQIVNLAIAKLGSDKFINDLSDETTEANLAKTIYDNVLDAVLKDGAWKFAIKRVILAASVDTPAFDTSFSYFPLPADCIHVLGTDIQNTTYEHAWEREGNSILSKGSSFPLKYVARITDVTAWDALFTMAFADRMAAEMCYAMTQNLSLYQLKLQIYQNSVSLARHRGSIETSPQRVLANLYDMSRIVQGTTSGW